MCCPPIFAQTNNSWTSATSGNWENVTSWSLGILPGTNQSIFLTNAGWKAVAIGPNTTQSFPQTMNVQTLTITSPTNTENTLLMNFSGQETPLVIGSRGGVPGSAGSLVVGSNSAFMMLSAGLKVISTTAPEGNGSISIGGTFTEDYGSQVDAGVLTLGDIGPAFFGLTNSLVETSTESIGGNFPAQFLHYSGTNYAGNMNILNGGEYDIYNGYLQAPISFQGGNFNQWGGYVDADLQFRNYSGTYHLAGGTLLLNSLAIPATPMQGGGIPESGTLVQTGGTNTTGTISLGSQYGMANYTLSGGLLSCSSVSVGYYEGPDTSIIASSFNQSGGLDTNSSITLAGTYDNTYRIKSGSYNLSGGALMTGPINVEMGLFTQSGGSNNATSIALNDVGDFDLSGGWVTTQTIQCNGGNLFNQIGTFTQSGGTNQTSDLFLDNDAIYKLSGGQLIAQTIEVTESATFNHSGGVLNLAGLLTLNEGTWNEQGSGQQFAQLQLSGGGDSIISFGAIPSVLQFANSSSLAWSSNATLTIQNWKGSLIGGGRQQILFGSNASALTAQQLNLIEFLNPAGLASGFYPARILANGELVPNAFRPVLGLSTSGGSAQLNLLGEANETYEIDVSSNLVNWSKLTSQMSSSNGTLSITDTFLKNYPARFYRAVIAP